MYLYRCLLEEKNLCYATLPLIFDTLCRKATKGRPMYSEESCHSVTQSVVFVETLKRAILLRNEESGKSFAHNVHFSTGPGWARDSGPAGPSISLGPGWARD